MQHLSESQKKRQCRARQRGPAADYNPAAGSLTCYPATEQLIRALSIIIVEGGGYQRETKIRKGKLGHLPALATVAPPPYRKRSQHLSLAAIHKNGYGLPL